MKTTTTILVVLSVLSFLNEAQSQIPNASFENWTNGEPDGWATSNLPPDFITVTASNESHSGAKALRGEVMRDTNGVLHRPIVFAGSDGGGFVVSGRYSALQGYYRLLLATLDQCIISVEMFKQGVQIGGGYFYADTTASGYTPFTATITYTSDSIPDWTTISIRTFCCGFASGTVFYVDDLSFATPTEVKEISDATPSTYNLYQNYPNPFNPRTTIQFSIPVGGRVSLKIFDLIGNEVASVVEQNLEPGTYSLVWDATSLPSGVYYTRLVTNDLVDVKKMMVVK